MHIKSSRYPTSGIVEEQSVTIFHIYEHLLTVLSWCNFVKLTLFSHKYLLFFAKITVFYLKLEKLCNTSSQDAPGIVFQYKLNTSHNYVQTLNILCFYTGVILPRKVQ